MANFPQEIVSDILSRLPVKSLSRFKCVSKQWFSLISNSQFAKIQHKRAKSSNYGNISKAFLTTCPLKSIDFEALSDGSGSNAFVELDYPLTEVPKGYKTLIIGSFNGLVCLAFDYSNIVLWNPTTGVFNELPRHNPFTPRFYSFYGLGYDISVDDFKVIVAEEEYFSEEDIVYVFSLKKKLWKEIQLKEIQMVFDSQNIFWGPGIQSCDSLYWVAEQERGLDIKYVIVAFDVSDERFKEVVPLADHIYEDAIDVELKIWKDHLVIFTVEENGSFHVREKNELSWSKLFSVSIVNLPNNQFEPTLVGLTQNGNVLVADNEELYLY